MERFHEKFPKIPSGSSLISMLGQSSRYRVMEEENRIEVYTYFHTKDKSNPDISIIHFNRTEHLKKSPKNATVFYNTTVENC